MRESLSIHTRSSELSSLLIATVIAALFVVAGMLHITDPVARAIAYAISPALYTTNKIKTSAKNEISIISQARTIVKQQKATTEQNVSLRAQVAQLAVIQEENKRLREQLGAPNVDKFKLIPARITSRDQELTVVFDNTPTVTKNSFIVYKNHLVGKVTRATNRSAVFILPTDPQMTIPVQILTADNKTVKAIVSGQFGTTMIADRIPQDAKVNKDDLVVVAKAPGLPDGVVIGEITEITKKESELFQRALVKPFIEYNDLDTVFIIQ